MFVDSSWPAALTPTWKVILLGDDDNFQVATQATERASDPAPAASLFILYADLFD
jgi:hypothetical protein